ncbi:tetratricopeptide repeat protein [Streptomyces lydicus]|uniref:tetratricopeptide repeat protein n=1 Tax=Streptomyces lydicus TaxID=47763 RepID=UPI0036845FDB
MDLRGAQGVQTGAGSHQYNYFSPAPAVSWPVRVGAVPTLASAFQPRTAVRKAVDAARASHTTVVLTQVLTGGGGVGKSQLASFYATQALTDGTDLVIWTNATDAEQVIGLYARAARRIHVPGAAGQDAETDAQAFLDWLATTSHSWLVVLDDVTDPQALARWWPNPSPTGNGHVLATTRRRDAILSGGGRAVIEVDTYSPQEALSYLHSRLTDAGAAHLLDVGTTAVAEELGRLPLALSHAGAYMINEDVSCSDYLQRLTDHQSRLQDLLPPDADSEGYGRHVTAALLLTLDAAQQCRPVGLALPALRLAACLDPAGHPKVLWTTTAITDYLTAHRLTGNEQRDGDQGEVSADQAQAALRLLHRYALVTCETAGPRAVRIHALTARATRETTLASEIPTAACSVADALHTIWPQEDHNDLELCAVLRANTESLIPHGGDHLWHSQQFQVLYRSGQSLLDTGLYTTAIAYWQRLAADAERLLGHEHPDMLISREHLATSYGKLGRFHEAIAVEERVACERERILGPEHPETLRAWSNLGTSYFQAGRTDEAITIDQRVTHERERILGPAHPETLRAWLNLAACYWEGGRTDEAITIEERVTRERERILGPEHPSTLAAWHNLASSYRHSGRTDEAITISERITTEFERAFSPQHPDALTLWQSLAASYRQADRTDEAITIDQRVTRERERILGPAHPDTLFAWQSLAASYRHAGRIDEAIAIGERVANDSERILSSEHPDTLKAWHDLARSYWRARRASEAITLLQQVVTGRQRLLTPQHRDTAAAEEELRRWSSG